MVGEGVIRAKSPGVSWSPLLYKYYFTVFLCYISFRSLCWIRFFLKILNWPCLWKLLTLNTPQVKTSSTDPALPYKMKCPKFHLNDYKATQSMWFLHVVSVVPTFSCELRIQFNTKLNGEIWLFEKMFACTFQAQMCKHAHLANETQYTQQTRKIYEKIKRHDKIYKSKTIRRVCIQSHSLFKHSPQN